MKDLDLVKLLKKHHLKKQILIIYMLMRIIMFLWIQKHLNKVKLKKKLLVTKENYLLKILKYL